MALRAKPLTFKEACDYVSRYHRHNAAPRGMKFAVGAINDEGELVGVVMCGRPVARGLQDGWTLEVNRTCTRGGRNVNSFLYGVARRAAKAMGYRKLVTYTQKKEKGASLRGAGFVRTAELEKRESWFNSSKTWRERVKRDPVGTGGVARIRWEIVFND